MTAPLSVIIPTLNAADGLGPCLGALGEALFDGLIAEVIFADGGSSDAIADVADAVGARLITAPKGRGTQLAAGVQAAQAPWLLIVHADSVLGENWAGPVRDHIARHPDRAGWFRLRFRSDHPMARITERWANLRARLLALPYGDQGLLIPRTLYDRAGGYPDVPLMEDVALARRLGRALRPLDAQITTDASRYDRDGWIRRGSRNLGTLMRYLLGARPEDLARRYERR
ncbi:MAG: TIGR04283 family arsenosugar biosynthesis glycosyltransferase [Pseudomonadota bacterium]